MKTATVYLTALSVSVAVHALALGTMFGPPAQAQAQQVPLPKPRPTWPAGSPENPIVVNLPPLPPINSPMLRLDGRGIDNLLPPVYFDHPFPGKVTVVITQNLNQIAGCHTALACVTQRGPDYCIVFRMPDDVIEAKGKGMTVEVVMRHEIGHCNGWPSNHEGARTWWGESATNAWKAN